MTEFELLTQATASAASTPNFPLMIELAQIGFEVMRKARVQRTAGEMEIERASKCRATDKAHVIIVGPPHAAAPRYPGVDQR
jgi:hypothetical protein